MRRRRPATRTSTLPGASFIVVRFLCSKTVDDQAVAPGRFLTYHRGLQAKLRELGYHEDALCLRITGEA